LKAAIINQFGNPEVFEIAEMPIPKPGDDQLLVEVHASSVNPIDWKTRLGNLKYILGSGFPIVLGYDVAGKVEKTGKNVTGFKPGDLVYGRLDKKFGGALAEYAVGSANVFAPIPKGLSMEKAAAIPLAALTALQGLRDKTHVTLDDDVLVIGAAGGVGHFALQIAKIMGARVTAVCSARHQNMINILKPDRWIDYRTTDYLSEGKKYDVIYDAVGKESFLTCRHILKPGGTYINTLPRPKIILHKFLSVFTRGKKVKTLLMKPRADDLLWINEKIKSGQFQVFIDSVFTLNEISAAHERSEMGHAEGKIVIKIKG